MIKAKRGPYKKKGSGDSHPTQGTIHTYLTKPNIPMNGNKRLAIDMHAEDYENDDTGGGGAIHGRKCASKRTRMMTSEMTVPVLWGAKSKTSEQLQKVETDSSQKTTKMGSCKPTDERSIKKKTTHPNPRIPRGFPKKGGRLINSQNLDI